MNFDILGLEKNLVKSVKALGFEKPTPIQEKTIPELISGRRDFIGIAQTGTGKTAAYGLPLIQQIDFRRQYPQGIILCPTRELCLQITDDLKRFSLHVSGAQIVSVYGGASIVNQIKQLKKGAQVIVATPGRLTDLMDRNIVKTKSVSHIILDEADEMLNMGFQESIDQIISKMPKDRSTWLFSATMPKGIEAISMKYLTDPLKIKVGNQNLSPDAIKHICYVIHEKNRYEALKRIIDFTPELFGLVFCRTRKDTQDIAEQLQRDGYPTEALHGDLSQPQRDHVMHKFRNNSIRILVATDVAARGLDVNNITHIVHYHLPDDTDVYTHRSGRTARAGKSGVSMALINPNERRRIKIIEQKGKIRFHFSKIPGGRDICEKQLHALVNKITTSRKDDNGIEDYLPAVYDALDGIDRRELIKRFISEEFSHIIDYYRERRDINVAPAEKAKGMKKRVKKTADTGRNSENSFACEKKTSRIKGRKTQRFLINIGKFNNINKGAIVRLICDKAGIPANMIGRISLQQDSSFFDVEESAAGRINQFIANTRLDGRPVKIRKISSAKN